MTASALEPASNIPMTTFEGRTIPDKRLLVDGRRFLEHLEVVLFVTRVLVQDE